MGTLSWKNLPKKRMASGALIRNDKNEVLIVKPSYREGWLIPGGIVELNESPLKTCIRELKEELNLNISINKLLVVDYSPSEEDFLESVEYIFDGGFLTEQEIKNIHLPKEELLEFKFVPAETLKGYLVRRLYQRTTAALKALTNNETYYTESGNNM